jgi:hypothetical protein
MIGDKDPDPRACMTSDVEPILSILCDLARSMRPHGRMLNERYLHHAFTHRLQGAAELLGMAGEAGKPVLHPEWPTYKKGTGLTEYGRYRKGDGGYLPHPEGTAGFIDFALGDYRSPSIGIEFYLGYGWAHEHAIFDWLKLLDKANPFRVGISFNVIVRPNKLPQGGRLARLEARMNGAFDEAVARLNQYAELCAPTREFHCIIAEIDAQDARRHWHIRGLQGPFLPGLSDIDC